jgi:hypothetical protein
VCAAFRPRAPRSLHRGAAKRPRDNLFQCAGFALATQEARPPRASAVRYLTRALLYGTHEPRFRGAWLLISGIAVPFTARGAGPAEGTPAAESPAVNVEPQQREDSPERPLRWYGWQTLASDAASIGLIRTGFAVGDRSAGSDGSLTATSGFIGLGTAGYLGGAPTVHAFHHNPGRSIASVGLRLGLPLVSAIVGPRLKRVRPLEAKIFTSAAWTVP